uniref:Uncharacterized protein n=1 Tax=Timema cristinae TaxID=61476 RepID=A0A7R9CUM5_TIMCR|nr:unnamed protein product [Timema cristinae]
MFWEVGRLVENMCWSKTHIFQHPLVKRVKVVIETFLIRLNEATTTAKQTIHAVLGAVKHVLTEKENQVSTPLPTAQGLNLAQEVQRNARNSEYLVYTLSVP